MAGVSEWATGASIVYGGELSIIIEIVEPTDITITFNQNEDIDVDIESVFTLSVVEQFDDYALYFDGTEVIDFAGQDSVTINPAADGIEPGVHRFAVLITEAGQMYSKSYRFRLIN